MGKHKAPSCKQCRRESERLFLKGERCNTQKCTLARRNSSPGMHGASIKKMSDYAVRLREKQKLRRIYGVSEKQLRKYYQIARKSPGVTGTVLIQQLERRLDNIIYRLGIASSRKQARQLVKHSHFTVNEKRVNLPSFSVNPSDIIKVKERSQGSFESFIQKTRELHFHRIRPRTMAKYRLCRFVKIQTRILYRSGWLPVTTTLTDRKIARSHLCP